MTPEMIAAAKRFGVPEGTRLHTTDGIHIPEPNESFDAIWCCGVLRYSLFVEDPVYDQIAREMFRVLRPGGRAMVLEMYVDTPPEVFITDFRKTGFLLQDTRTIQRHDDRLELRCQDRLFPVPLVALAGRLTAADALSF